MTNDPRIKISKPFLSLPETQTFLGIKSRKTLLKYIREGKLTAYKIGGTRWRLAISDIEHFVQKSRTEGVPKRGKGALVLDELSR